MEEADKEKTAFVCPLGFYEFNRMPQGVTNAPSTFQRCMERCMGDLNLKEVLVFIDDLIIFSDTEEEHERRLLHVLNRLKEYGLKLSPGKCKFFQHSVRYLGHIVSQNGVETDPEKTSALKTWPKPSNLKELRSFLGFSGYYRRFIQDFSRIVKPLNELTAGYPPTCKRKGQMINAQYHNPKEAFGERWTASCQQAFDTVIEKLTSAPVLGFANPKLPYLLHTDASTTGLGAALYQQQDGELRAIAFASRGLSKSEARYPAHKLEFLALKWAVTEKFSDYLYGASFTVVTDSNPLTYILNSAKLDATSYRWLSALSTYSFKLQYRAGKQNVDADALSRRPHGELMDDHVLQKEKERIYKFTANHLSETEASEVIQPEVIKALCERHDVYSGVESSDSSDHSVALVESIAFSLEALPPCFQREDNHGLPVIPSLSLAELSEKQHADASIREIITQLESGESPPLQVRKELTEYSLLLREWNRLELKNGILYRKRQGVTGVTHQLVLPRQLRDIVLESLHNDMGHLGIERTLDLVRARFYWPKMSSAVERKVKTCDRCVRRKTPPERAAPMVSIKTSRPLELVCMDFLSVEPDRSNTKDILVITDHFTKYALAIPTPNQKASTVAKCLWDHFISHYGFPEKLHSDQGPDFESRTIRELCEVAGIRKTRTTPYHPKGNPVERFNRTLLQMLGTLNNKDKSQWRDFVKPLVHAYNCTKHEVTGFAPYELMFGRQPRLPVDLAFGLPVDDQPLSHSQYVQGLKNRLKESYELCSRNAKKSAERNKVRFDKKVTDSSLEPGDRVLVKNVRLRGKHKLADKWEADVYVVVSRAGDLPVYTVRPEAREGPSRTLHRDLLLPCGFLPVSAPETPAPPAVRRPRTRQNPGNANESSGDVNSEDDEEYPLRLVTVEPAVFTMIPEVDPISPNVALEQQSNGNVIPLTKDLAPEAVPDEIEVEIQIEAEEEASAASPPQLGCSDFEEPEGTGGDESESSMEDGEAPVPPISPAGESQLLAMESAKPVPQTNDKATVSHPTELSEELEETVRCSNRQRTQPKRLHYTELGNPLIEVVQSLFQGLSTAITRSLNGVDPLFHDQTSTTPFVPVTRQPQRGCTGTCHPSLGEGVTLESY